MATHQPLDHGYPEPNQRWKAQLKSRIDENLQKLLDDAKISYEQKVGDCVVVTHGQCYSLTILSAV